MRLRMKTLSDLSPMPWGAHRGKPMQNVPASYLHWLWTKKDFMHAEDDPVADYIRRNLNGLRMEYRDGIWT